MPSAIFEIGDAIKYEVEVVYSYFGTEQVFVNGELIDKRWSLVPSSRRSYRIGEHVVEIDVSVLPWRYHCSVYSDGELYIEELFPELAARAWKFKNDNERSALVRAVIWLTIAVVLVKWLSNNAG